MEKRRTFIISPLFQDSKERENNEPNAVSVRGEGPDASLLVGNTKGRGGEGEGFFFGGQYFGQYYHLPTLVLDSTERFMGRERNSTL